MSAAPNLLTADEFERLPEPKEGGKLELIRGQVVYMVPVNAAHGRASRRIGSRLGDFADKRKLGDVGVEVGFRLGSNPDTVLGPDVSYVAGALHDAQGWIDGAPTLAVEVVSPNDRDIDVQRKVEAYIAAGSQRVWTARPEQSTVTVHYPDRTARTLVKGDVLTSDDAAFGVEGFELAVADIFAE